MNPKISIVVPVYKVEPYIHKCIDSILNQTFKDFELILVDDGSPDKCGEICDEYSKKDKRVVVIHKENGGQAAARNSALDIARGEYIGFVDSDDCIDKNMYEFLYKVCIEENSEISIIGVKEINENGECLYKYVPKDISFSNIFKRAHLWNKLYKRELFYNNNLSFTDGRYYEDLELVPKLFVNAKKVSCIDYIGYNYLQRKGSITHSKDEKILDNIWAYVSVKRYLKEKNLYYKYEKEFNIAINYFKDFYINILREYSTIFIIKNSKIIINAFTELGIFNMRELSRFTLLYIKTKIYIVKKYIKG